MVFASTWVCRTDLNGFEHLADKRGLVAWTNRALDTLDRLENRRDDQGEEDRRDDPHSYTENLSSEKVGYGMGMGMDP